jgi:hypothetical protein
MSLLITDTDYETRRIALQQRRKSLIQMIDRLQAEINEVDARIDKLEDHCPFCGSTEGGCWACKETQ